MAAQSWRKFVINYQYFTVDNVKNFITAVVHD